MNEILVGLRSLAFLFCLAAAVVAYSIPLSIAGWFMPPALRNGIGRSWARTCLWLLRSICGLDYRIRGDERLPARGCVALSKHQSAWETIALRAILPPAQTWVLKRELLWVPFFGWALAPYRPIAIDRQSGRTAVKQLVEQGAHWLSRGNWVIIFPEGTRVAPGQRKRYGVGGALLAAQTQTPIVPIAHNAGVYWQRRALMKYPGCIEVVIGEPIMPAGKSAHDLNREVENWIESVTASLPMDRSTAADCAAKQP